MNKRLLLVAILCFAPHTVFASSKFSPQNCEFSVEFPNIYETKEIFSPQGNSTILATNPKGSPTKLSAECWPNREISPREYASKLQTTAGSRGIEVKNITVGNDKGVQQVVLSGTIGQQPNLYQLRLISYFGKSSRLDLLIMDKRLDLGDEAQIFRNSVRVKN